jgi:hypothetical protein
LTTGVIISFRTKTVLNGVSHGMLNLYFVEVEHLRKMEVNGKITPGETG